jgi:hypothetical protein
LVVPVSVARTAEQVKPNVDRARESPDLGDGRGLGGRECLTEMAGFFTKSGRLGDPALPSNGA